MACRSRSRSIFSFRTRRVGSVGTKGGATAFTEMPISAYSRAITSVRETTAALEAAAGLNVCKEPDLSEVGVFEAGESVTLCWEVCACKNEGVYTFDISATGLVDGSLGPWKDYPAYDYVDLIGGTASFSVEIAA